MAEKNSAKNTHEKHRERMRDRFAESGFENYRPHEVLEQVLFECLPRVNTNPIGHALIDRFGSLMNVLDASPKELCEIKGIGKRSAEYIASIKPTVGEMIGMQYREMGSMTHEMTTFVIDWFMRKESGVIGLIVCDADGSFVGYRELTFAPREGADLDCESLGGQISSLVGKGKYIVAFNEADRVPRSTVYRLLDCTAALGAVMSDAFIVSGVKLESVLFNK